MSAFLTSFVPMSVASLARALQGVMALDQGGAPAPMDVEKEAAPVSKVRVAKSSEWTPMTRDTFQAGSYWQCVAGST